MKRHITPFDVASYVLGGTGVVEIGDEKMQVTPDTLIKSRKTFYIADTMTAVIYYGFW